MPRSRGSLFESVPFKSFKNIILQDDYFLCYGKGGIPFNFLLVFREENFDFCEDIFLKLFWTISISELISFF